MYLQGKQNTYVCLHGQVSIQSCVCPEEENVPNNLHEVVLEYVVHLHVQMSMGDVLEIHSNNSGSEGMGNIPSTLT